MTKRNINHKPEDGTTLWYVYFFAILLWIFFAIYYHLAYRQRITIIGFLILTIPIFVYVTGLVNGKYISEAEADELFSSNFLSISVLITVPLLTWLGNQVGEHQKFIPLILIALILILLSNLDLWVSQSWVNITRHIKSILTTASIVIIIYAIYAFYLSHCDNGYFNFLAKQPAKKNENE